MNNKNSIPKSGSLNSFSFSRSDILNGKVLVDAGPGQIGYDPSTTYIPPDDWLKSGSLLRLPKVVRIMFGNGAMRIAWRQTRQSIKNYYGNRTDFFIFDDNISLFLPDPYNIGDCKYFYRNTTPAQFLHEDKIFIGTNVLNIIFITQGVEWVPSNPGPDAVYILSAPVPYNDPEKIDETKSILQWAYPLYYASKTIVFTDIDFFAWQNTSGSRFPIAYDYTPAQAMLEMEMACNSMSDYNFSWEGTFDSGWRAIYEGGSTDYPDYSLFFIPYIDDFFGFN